MQSKGSVASEGIAMGRAFVLPAWEWELPEHSIEARDLPAEFERLYRGIMSSKQELNTIKQEIVEMIGHQESSIFDAHMAILDDPVFMSEVQGIIRRQYKAAEVAVKEAIDKFANMFDLLDDEYMKERAADIKDVGNRLIKHLIGAPEVRLPEDNQPFILVARDMTPSQLVHLNPQHVLGIVTMAGGQTSHTAIMARALGIPFIIGLEGKLRQQILTGDYLIIDGETGSLYVNPDEETIRKFERRREELRRKQAELERIVHVPAVTRDNQTVTIDANISTIKELDDALRYGINGIGLFRTEYLYMDRDTLPEEGEQFEVYRQAAEKLGGRPLTIRTMDIGADKQANCFLIPEENNPALGYRAIRVSLDQRHIFKTQLRAILRASHYGNVQLMYPMISSVNELRQANEVLETAKQELRTEKVPFDENLKVGVTIELPAAVLIADLLALESDFLSIGTNDLTQYTLAVDRMNEQIAHMYNSYHPALIRMLKQVADAARRAGIPVSVCGEMAGDVKAVPIWLGLGIHQLSMSAKSILAVKNRILQSEAQKCRELLKQMLQCKTSEEIERLLEQGD